MRGAMANSSQSHNAHGASRPATRDRSPDPPMGRSGCCTGFLCLGSLKRGKRIVPATRIHDGSNSSPRPWGSNGAPQSNPANLYATLSPSLLAPPSSPASFQNSAVQSSAQSPCAFPVAMSAPSATSQIPLETAQTMFQMGPYAHETALVSPPVFSNFTTAPSTAPFTPPPELATHVTTPSSPDVPFAQLLANSFGTKAVVRSQPTPTYSASPFASPDIFAAEDLQAAYQLYPGSPLAHLLSPTSGTGASTPLPDSERSAQFTPFQDLENPVQAVASMFIPGSPMPPPTTAPGLGLEVGPVLSQTPKSGSSQIPDPGASKTGNFPPFQDSNPAGQQQQQQQQQLSATISSFLASGDNPSGPKLVGCAQFENGERLLIGVNNGSSGQKVTQARVSECAVVPESIEEGISEATVDCISKGESNGELSGLGLSNERSIQFNPGNIDSSGEAEKNVQRSEFVLSGDSSVEFQSGKVESLDQTGRNVEPSGLVMSDENSVLPQPGSIESSDGAGRNTGLPALILADNSTIQLPVAKLESIDKKDGNVEPSDSQDDTVTAVEFQPVGLQPFNQAERNVGLSGLILSADGKAVEPVTLELADVPDRSMGPSGLVLPECAVVELQASKLEPSDKPDEILGQGGSASLYANSSQLVRGKIESCDKPERDFSQIAVCSLGPVQNLKRLPGGEDGALECIEAVGQNNVRLRQPSSSVLDVTIGDLVAWETVAGDRTPKKLSISKIALLDTSRAGSAVHSRSSSRDAASLPGTSPLRRPSDSGICTDCVRLQHVTVATTDGYFDASAPEQFSFTNPKFNPEANCGEEKGQDSGRGGNVDDKCGVRKVLLETPTGVASKDRGSVYREQQVNVPVKWIQAGAKLHQRSPEQVPRELTELGSTCSGPQNVPSPSLGMNLVEELK